MRTSLPSSVKPPIKRAFATVYRSLARPKAAFRVVMYHSVGGAPRSQSIGAFEEQIRYLRDHVEIVSPAELTIPSRSNEPRVLLTFDDGYRDNYDVVAPILDRLGLRAVFFVVTGLVNGNYRLSRAREYSLYEHTPLMTWQQIGELHRAGMEIGSHTRFHADFARCSTSRIEREIRHSIGAIRERLGKTRVLFAYPFGQQRQLTVSSRETLRSAGVECAFSTFWGSVNRTSDPLAVPRIRIDPTDTLTDFVAKLSGSWDFIRWIHGSSPSD